MSNFFRGTLALVVGPSGVGKGTTVSLLKKRHPEWIFPVSATTRPPRPKEKEGETYHFFSPETFDKKITDGEFLEWAWVHKKHKYGMLRSEIFPPLQNGKVVLREVDIQGFLDARKIVPEKSLVSFFYFLPKKKF
jgi:guanylate kinase